MYTQKWLLLSQILYENVLMSKDITFCCLGYVCKALFMHRLFRTSCSSHQSCSHFHTQLELIQKSCSGTQLSKPSIFLLITPREQTTLHPKGKLLMALNMFVSKKFGQATKCFDETGSRSCNWTRLSLHKEATNCQV